MELRAEAKALAALELASDDCGTCEWQIGDQW